jgi:hypothetical protein
MVVLVSVTKSSRNEVVVSVVVNSVVLVTMVVPVKCVVVRVSVPVIVVRDVTLVSVTVDELVIVVVSVVVGHVCGNESAGKSLMVGKPGVLAGMAENRTKFNCIWQLVSACGSQQNTLHMLFIGTVLAPVPRSACPVHTPSESMSERAQVSGGFVDMIHAENPSFPSRPSQSGSSYK